LPGRAGRWDCAASHGIDQQAEAHHHRDVEHVVVDAVGPDRGEDDDEAHCDRVGDPEHCYEKGNEEDVHQQQERVPHVHARDEALDQIGIAREEQLTGTDAPMIELSEKPLGYATAIKPGDRFNIEDSSLDGISGDLFISASSSGHIFVDREGPENRSWLRISGKSYLEARRCFHRSTVDLDPVGLKLRDIL